MRGITLDRIQASIFLLREATNCILAALQQADGDINISWAIQQANAAWKHGEDLALEAEDLALRSRSEIEEAKTQQAEAETKIQLANALQAKAQVEIEALKAEAQLLQAQRAAAEEEVETQRIIFQFLARARQGVLQIMLKRFLALAEFANNLVAKITNPDLLLDLFSKLALAENAEEAEQCLRSVQAAIA